MNNRQTRSHSSTQRQTIEAGPTTALSNRAHVPSSTTKATQYLSKEQPPSLSKPQVLSFMTPGETPCLVPNLIRTSAVSSPVVFSASRNYLTLSK